MARTLPTFLFALLISVGAGLFLGETTVSAMQVRRADEKVQVPAGDQLVQAGQRWAQRHHPANADACPQPTLLFQWGCVSATRN